MTPLLSAAFWLVLKILQIYLWILIASVVASWLVAFSVINTRHPAIRRILLVLERLTEPLLRPIRRIIPPVAGMDLSPIILALAIIFLQRIIIMYWPMVLY
ncbi:MAG: YggT family protein [Pseudomonadota bacterium]|nr:YggT family protein [Pseudomonadota bacterium]